jgi:hypothetical protein
MKRAVSISIGSSKRNKAAEATLLGEKVSIERIGTDGDMQAAALKYKELDGKVDAFGVGGAELAVLVDGKRFPLYSARPMMRFVKKTPIVDGSGLKNTLENKAPPFLDKKIDDYLSKCGRSVLVVEGVSRWGLSKSFAEAGYETIFGDFMFGLGLPIAIRKLSQLKTLAHVLLPIVLRLPFKWIYPTGEKQEKRTPKWGNYYAWATVIAGDCHYIKRFMPDDLTGKVIVTNTTTPDDVETFRKARVKYLVTTTPVLEGRSFGTNMMEAALVAVSGKRRPLTLPELSEMIETLGFEPQLQELN